MSLLVWTRRVSSACRLTEMDDGAREQPARAVASEWRGVDGERWLCKPETVEGRFGWLVRHVVNHKQNRNNAGDLRSTLVDKGVRLSLHALLGTWTARPALNEVVRQERYLRDGVYVDDGRGTSKLRQLARAI